MAAGHTAYYQHLGLAGGAGSERLETVPDWYPKVEWAFRARRRQAFHNPLASKPELKRLRSPVYPVPRTAVFLAGFDENAYEESASVRVLRRDQLDHLGRFGPESIAAPSNMLLRLARRVERRDVFVPRLHHCLIAFSHFGDEPLDGAGRDFLWRVFRVPLFEQLLGTDGAVVAAECDAHEGLHLQSDQAIVEQEPSGEFLLTSLTDLRFPAIRVATGWTGSIDRSLCGCGQPHPRLTGLKRMAAQPKVLAARA